MFCVGSSTVTLIVCKQRVNTFFCFGIHLQDLVSCFVIFFKNHHIIDMSSRSSVTLIIVLSVLALLTSRLSGKDAAAPAAPATPAAGVAQKEGRTWESEPPAPRVSGALLATRPTLPASPLSSQRARMAIWRRVQRTVDVEASRRVVEAHAALCGARKEAGGAASPDPPAKLTDHQFVVLNVFGASADRAINEAGHRRVLVAINTGPGNATRLCRSGAIIDASVASEDDKVDVDFVAEVEGAPGLYEIQPYFRRAGRYTLCLALNAISPAFKWRATMANLDPELAVPAVGHNNSWIRNGNMPRYFEDARRNSVAQSVSPDHCVWQSWTGRQCFAADVACGAECLAAQRQLGTQRARGGVCGGGDTLTNAFRSGAWMRLSSCDGNLCVGSPRDAFPPDDSLRPNFYTRFATKTKWWVFVSDTCTVRLYSREEAWRILNGKWIVNWGDSTLQQPAVNFLEYMLGVPVLPQRGFAELYRPRTKNMAPKKSLGARKTAFWPYRSWDRVASSKNASLRRASATSAPPPVRRMRSTLCWGGCPHVGSKPVCGKAMGLATTSCVRQILTGNFTPAARVSIVPNVILLNHFMWRAPMWDPPAFMRQMSDTLQWLEGAVAARLTHLAAATKSRTAKSFCDVPAVLGLRPALVWMGPARSVFGDWEAQECAADNRLTFHRHMAWQIDALMTRYRGAASASPCSPFSDVVFMGRHELTTPLHSGHEFGHLAIHYGASRGICRVSDMRGERYGMASCLHNTTADDMMTQWWLAVLDRQRKTL